MKKLTKEVYTKFLNDIVYDWQDPQIVAQNNACIGKPIKEICDIQLEKFDGDNKKGCCFNFSFYLFAKYEGFILTCKDKIGIHCAFIYNKDGEFFVCDPASAKIYENDIYFDIPLKDYHFDVENIEQIYTIYLSMKNNDNTRTFRSFLTSRDVLTDDKTFADKIITKNLKEVDINVLETAIATI